MSDSSNRPPPDDTVGYGRPPKASQFKPGQSGNPRGKPKGVRSVGAILNDVMNRKVSITENGKSRRVTALEGMVRRLLNESLRGDKAAAKIVLPLFERYAETPEGATRTEDLLAEDREVLARFMQLSEASSKEASPDGAAGAGAAAQDPSEGGDRDDV